MPDDHHTCKCRTVEGAAGSIYGFAFIGAAVYYITHAVSFWGGVWGVIKAMLWPAFLIYELLDFLKM